METLQSENGRWRLPFDGQFVHAVVRGADTSVRLDVSTVEHQELRIACAYRLTSPDGRVVDGDPENVDQVPPLLALAGRTVRRSDFGEDLRVEFDDGSVLSIGPHAAYEAWEVHAAGGLLVVATPGGGEPAIWSPDGRLRVSLSAPQAFEAMRRYLTAYWERGGRQDDELMLVLSAMDTTTWQDGGTADRAAWHDWETAVSETLAKKDAD